MIYILTDKVDKGEQYARTRGWDSSTYAVLIKPEDAADRSIGSKDRVITLGEYDDDILFALTISPIRVD